MSAIQRIRERYQKKFGGEPSLYRAPGRVNLIGEHTDYNDGFVMPAALDMYTWVAAGPRADDKLVVFAENFGESAEFPFGQLDGPPRQHWTDYVRGVAAVLLRGHRLRGANLVILGEVPLGSGLSSSAAIEIATGYALLDLAGIGIDRRDLALAAQRAEHEFVGTRCGIMDQFISAFGERGEALLLDCRSLEYQLLPVPEEASIVLCNSMVKHDLATGEYNVRRSECERGVKALQTRYPEVHALRDASLEQLAEVRDRVGETVFRRCRHVISENTRTLAAAEALKAHDLPRFGELMRESHRSLRDDYEVSCRELDILVETASGFAGVYGARMTGGGFGGCTVNLVENEFAGTFRDYMKAEYKKQTGIEPEVYVSSASEGAGKIELRRWRE